MCGITGAFSTGECSATVAAMTDFVQHRGPDDVGSAEIHTRDGQVRGAFGHRRLAILDLSALGHQPMFSHDKSLCMTFNGEIYNYRELRRELEQRGLTFKSGSDTEVILEGWKLYGWQFLRRLRGMFALAMWDRDASCGYLVRDAFGIKPLYAARDRDTLLFASEVRALLKTNRVPKKLSAAAVRTYLATGSVSEPLTIIEDVFAVPPGCVIPILVSEKSLVVREPIRFASPVVPSEFVRAETAESHIPRIREALRDSVERHLVSDVPVAVFLSGGIDSSAVAGLASEVSTTPIESFTVVFEEADFSEAESARQSAKKFGTIHHEVMLSSSDLLNALPDVFESMDQPSLDGLNTFVVSRAVKAFGLKVVLSGLGGDELFGGYPSFFRAQRVAPLWQLPGSVRRMAAAGVGSFSGSRADRIGTMLTETNAPYAAYKASRTLFSDASIFRLTGVRPDANPAPSTVDGIEMDRLDPLQQVSMLELTGYMRNTLLRDSDVFSMAHALELRVPFVDRKVAQVAYEAAAGLRLNPGSVKPLLVEAVKDLIPAETAERTKMGFTLPFETWMKGEMFQEVDSLLKQASASGLRIDQDEVNGTWEAFQAGRGGVNWSRPWALYTLLRWAQHNGISYEDH